MSNSTLHQPTTNGHGRPLPGVRTYRGRKLEDLIPRIRAELGPDAVILRQREGLMGGFGGFFAQRCVEVDAQAAERIDFYDDDQGHPASSAAEPTSARAAAERSMTPAPVAADALALDEASPMATPQDAQRFLASLEQATMRVQQAELARPPQLEVGSGPGVAEDGIYAAEEDARLDDEGSAWLAAEDDARRNDDGPAWLADQDEAPLDAEEEARLEAEAEARLEAEEEARLEAEEEARLEAEEQARLAAEEEARLAAEEEARLEAEEEARLEAEEEARRDADQAAQRAAEEQARVAAEHEAQRMVAEEEVRVMAAQEARRLAAEQEAQRLIAEEQARLFAEEEVCRVAAEDDARRMAEPARADHVGAAELMGELTGHGIGHERARELVLGVLTHWRPFAGQGGLRDGVRGALAAQLPAVASLPASGAAIAVIGAGGAGKTQCVAALATAYARAGDLRVTVIAPDTEDAGVELVRLLRGENVQVLVNTRPYATAQAVGDARRNGLVIVDTVAVAPSDQRGLAELKATLAPLTLDARYLTLPATLSAQAGARLIDGFAGVAPSGIAVTHIDEGDQLGVAIELALTSGVPVAYMHEGLELATAITPAYPSTLAQRLVP